MDVTFTFAHHNTVKLVNSQSTERFKYTLEAMAFGPANTWFQTGDPFSLSANTAKIAVEDQCYIAMRIEGHLGNASAVLVGTFGTRMS